MSLIFAGATPSKIVLIEGNMFQRLALVDILTLCRYKCVAFESAKEAEEFLLTVASSLTRSKDKRRRRHRAETKRCATVRTPISPLLSDQENRTPRALNLVEVVEETSQHGVPAGEHPGRGLEACPGLETPLAVLGGSPGSERTLDTLSMNESNDASTSSSRLYSPQLGCHDSFQIMKTKVGQQASTQSGGEPTEITLDLATLPASCLRKSDSGQGSPSRTSTEELEAAVLAASDSSRAWASDCPEKNSAFLPDQRSPTPAYSHEPSDEHQLQSRVSENSGQLSDSASGGDAPVLARGEEAIARVLGCTKRPSIEVRPPAPLDEARQDSTETTGPAVRSASTPATLFSVGSPSSLLAGRYLSVGSGSRDVMAFRGWKAKAMLGDTVSEPPSEGLGSLGGGSKLLCLQRTGSSPAKRNKEALKKQKKGRPEEVPGGKAESTRWAEDTDKGDQRRLDWQSSSGLSCRSEAGSDAGRVRGESEEGLKARAEEGVELILCDRNAAGMEDFGFLRFISESKDPWIASLPVVVIGASLDTVTRETCKALGARACIQKPLTLPVIKTLFSLFNRPAKRRVARRACRRNPEMMSGADGDVTSQAPSPAISSPALSYIGSPCEVTETEGQGEKRSEIENANFFARLGRQAEDLSFAVSEEVEPRFDLLVEMDGKLRRGEEGKDALDLGLVAFRDKPTPSMSRQFQSLGERRDVHKSPENEAEAVAPKPQAGMCSVRRCWSSEGGFCGLPPVGQDDDPTLERSSSRSSSQEQRIPTTLPDIYITHLEDNAVTSFSDVRLSSPSASDDTAGTSSSPGGTCTSCVTPSSLSFGTGGRASLESALSNASGGECRTRGTEEENRRQESRGKLKEERTGDRDTTADMEARRRETETVDEKGKRHKEMTSVGSHERLPNTVVATQRDSSVSHFEQQTALESLALVRQNKEKDRGMPAKEGQEISLEERSVGKEESETLVQSGGLRFADKGREDKPWTHSSHQETQACAKPAEETERKFQGTEPTGEAGVRCREGNNNTKEEGRKHNVHGDQNCGLFGVPVSQYPSTSGPLEGESVCPNIDFKRCQQECQSLEDLKTFSAEAEDTMVSKTGNGYLPPVTRARVASCGGDSRQSFLAETGEGVEDSGRQANKQETAQLCKEVKAMDARGERESVFKEASQTHEDYHCRSKGKNKDDIFCTPPVETGRENLIDGVRSDNYTASHVECTLGRGMMPPDGDGIIVRKAAKDSTRQFTGSAKDTPGELSCSIVRRGEGPVCLSSPSQVQTGDVIASRRSTSLLPEVANKSTKSNTPSCSREEEEVDEDVTSALSSSHEESELKCFTSMASGAATAEAFLERRRASGLSDRLLLSSLAEGGGETLLLKALSDGILYQKSENSFDRSSDTTRRLLSCSSDIRKDSVGLKAEVGRSSPLAGERKSSRQWKDEEGADHVKRLLKEKELLRCASSTPVDRDILDFQRGKVVKTERSPYENTGVRFPGSTAKEFKFTKAPPSFSSSSSLLIHTPSSSEVPLFKLQPEESCCHHSLRIAGRKDEDKLGPPNMNAADERGMQRGDADSLVSCSLPSSSSSLGMDGNTGNEQEGKKHLATEEKENSGGDLIRRLHQKAVVDFQKLFQHGQKRKPSSACKEGGEPNSSIKKEDGRGEGGGSKNNGVNKNGDQSEDDEEDEDESDDDAFSSDYGDWSSEEESDDGENKFSVYERVSTLDRGATSYVHLVRRLSDMKPFAHKEILLEWMTPSEQELAKNEVRVLRALRDPPMIRYEESWIDPGHTLNIILEYAPGGTLQSYLERARASQVRISTSQIIQWVAEITVGLLVLHDKNILHRDMKTSNILLANDLGIRLCDFGISRNLTSPQEMARTAVGTPYVMSPELCQGKPYNAASDLWALGVVTFELLELRRPFSGDSLQSLFHAIETDTLVFQSSSLASSHEVSSSVLTKISVDTPEKCKDNDVGILFFKPPLDPHHPADAPSSIFGNHPSSLEENYRSREDTNADEEISESRRQQRSEVTKTMKPSCGSTLNEDEGKILQNKGNEKEVESDDEPESSVEDEGDRDEARIERRRSDLIELCRALLRKDPEARPTALDVAISSFLIHPVTKYIRENRPLDSNHLLELIGKHHRRRMDDTLIAPPLSTPSFSLDSSSASSSSSSSLPASTTVTAAVVSKFPLSRASSLRKKESQESTRQEDEKDGDLLLRGASPSFLSSETKSRSISQSEGSCLRRSSCQFNEEEREKRFHQSDLDDDKDDSEQKLYVKVDKEKKEKEMEEEETIVNASLSLELPAETEEEGEIQRRTRKEALDGKSVDSSVLKLSSSPCKRCTLGLHASHCCRKPSGVCQVVTGGHTGRDEEDVVVDTTSRALFVVEEEEEGEDDEDDILRGGEGGDPHRNEEEDQDDQNDEVSTEGRSSPERRSEETRRGEPNAVVVKTGYNKGEGRVSREDSLSELRTNELPFEKNRMKDCLLEESGIPSSLIFQETEQAPGDFSNNKKKNETGTPAALQIGNASFIQRPVSLYSKTKAEISTNGNSHHICSATQSLPSSAKEAWQTPSAGTAVFGIPSSKEGEVVDQFIVLSQRNGRQLPTTRGSKEEPEKDHDESAKERKAEHEAALIIPGNFGDPKWGRGEGETITIEISEEPSLLPVTIKVTGSKRKFFSSLPDESPAPIQMRAGTCVLSPRDDDHSKATPSEGVLVCRSPREKETQQQEQRQQQIITVVSEPCQKASLKEEISGREMSTPVFFISRDSYNLQSLIDRKNDRIQSTGLSPRNEGGAVVVDLARGETETRRLLHLSDSAEEDLMTSHALQSGVEEADNRRHRGDTSGSIRQENISQGSQLDYSADAKRGCHTTVNEETSSRSSARRQDGCEVKSDRSTTVIPFMEDVKGEGEEGQVKPQQEQQEEGKTSSGRRGEEEEERSPSGRKVEEGYMLKEDVSNESQVISRAPAPLLSKQTAEELLRRESRDTTREEYPLSAVTKEEKGHLSFSSSLQKGNGISSLSQATCNNVEGLLHTRSMTGETPTSTTARDLVMHRWNSGVTCFGETKKTPKDFISVSCPGSMELTSAMKEGDYRSPISSSRGQSVLTPEEMGRGLMPGRDWRRHHHRRGRPFEETGRESYDEETMADEFSLHQEKSTPAHTPLLSGCTLPLSSSSCTTPKTTMVSPLCHPRDPVKPEEEFRSSPLGTPSPGDLHASSSSLPLSPVGLDDTTSAKKSSLLPLPRCYYRSLSSSPYPSCSPFTTAASFSHRTSGVNPSCLPQRNSSSTDYRPLPGGGGGDRSSPLVHLRSNLAMIRRYPYHSSSSFRSSSSSASTASSSTCHLTPTPTGTPTCPFFSIGAAGSMSSSFSSEVTAAACRGGSSSSFYHPSPLSVSRWPTSCSTPASQIASASRQPPSPNVLGVQQTSSQPPTPLHVKNDGLGRQRLSLMTLMKDRRISTGSPTQVDSSPLTTTITQGGRRRVGGKTEGVGVDYELVQGDSSYKGISLDDLLLKELRRRRSHDIHMTADESPVRETSSYSSILLAGGGRSLRSSSSTASRDLQSLPLYQHLLMYGESSSSPCPCIPSPCLEESCLGTDPDLVSSCRLSPQASPDHFFTSSSFPSSLSSNPGSSTMTTTTTTAVLAFPSSSTTRPRLLSSAFHHHPAASSSVLQDSADESGKVIAEECPHLSEEERKASSGDSFELNANRTAAGQPPLDKSGECPRISTSKPVERSLMSSSSVERAEEKICENREVMMTVEETDSLDSERKPRSDEVSLVRDVRSSSDRDIVFLQNKHQIGLIEEEEEKEKQGVHLLHAKRHIIEEQEEGEIGEEKKTTTRHTSFSFSSGIFQEEEEGVLKIVSRRLAGSLPGVGRIMIEDETRGSLEHQIPSLQVNPPTYPPMTSSSSHYPSSSFRTASSSLEDLTSSDAFSSRKVSVDPLEEKLSPMHMTSRKDENERTPSSSSCFLARTYDSTAARLEKIRKRASSRSSLRQSCSCSDGSDEFAAFSRKGEGRRGRRVRDRCPLSRGEEDESHLYVTRTPPPLRYETHSSRSSYDQSKEDHRLPSSKRSDVRPSGTIVHREKVVGSPRLYRDLCKKKISSSSAESAGRDAFFSETNREANTSVVKSPMTTIPTHHHYHDTSGMSCKGMGSIPGCYPKRREKKREREIDFVPEKTLTGEGSHAMTTALHTSSEKEDDTFYLTNHSRWCNYICPPNERGRARPSHKKEEAILPSIEGSSSKSHDREASEQRRLSPHRHAKKRVEAHRCSCCPSGDPLECVHTLRTIALAMHNYLVPGPVTVYSSPLVSSSSCLPSSCCSRDVLYIDSIFHPSRRHYYYDRNRDTRSEKDSLALFPEEVSHPAKLLHLLSPSRREVKKERREGRETHDHHRHCPGRKRRERERRGGKPSHTVATSTVASSSSLSSLPSTLSLKDVSSSSFSSSCAATRSQSDQQGRGELGDCETSSFSDREKSRNNGSSSGRGRHRHYYYCCCRYVPFSHIIYRRVSALRRILLIWVLPPLLLLLVFLLLSGSPILVMFHPISGLISERTQGPSYLHNTYRKSRHPTAREWRDAKNLSSSSHAYRHHHLHPYKMPSTRESRRRDAEKPSKSPMILDSRRSMNNPTGASSPSRRNDMTPSKDKRAVRVERPTTVKMISPLVHSRRGTSMEETASRRREKLVIRDLSLDDDNDENEGHHSEREDEASHGAAPSVYRLDKQVDSDSSTEYPYAVQASRVSFSISPRARGAGAVSADEGTFSPVFMRVVGERDRELQSSRKRRRHTSAPVDLRLLSSPSSKDLESSGDDVRESKEGNRCLIEKNTGNISPFVSSLEWLFLSNARLKQRRFFSFEDRKKKQDGEVEVGEGLRGHKSDEGDVDEDYYHSGEEQDDVRFPSALPGSVERFFEDFGDRSSPSIRVWRSFLFYSSFLRGIVLLFVLVLLSLCCWATCWLKKGFFSSSSALRGHSRKKEVSSSSSVLIVPSSSSSRCCSSSKDRKKKDKDRRWRTGKQGGDLNYWRSTGGSSPCHLSEKELNDDFSSCSSSSSSSAAAAEEEGYFFFSKSKEGDMIRCYPRDRASSDEGFKDEEEEESEDDDRMKKNIRAEKKKKRCLDSSSMPRIQTEEEEEREEKAGGGIEAPVVLDFIQAFSGVSRHAAERLLLCLLKTGLCTASSPSRERVSENKTLTSRFPEPLGSQRISFSSTPSICHGISDSPSRLGSFDRIDDDGEERKKRLHYNRDRQRDERLSQKKTRLFSKEPSPSFSSSSSQDQEDLRENSSKKKKKR